MENRSLILKGNICYSERKDKIQIYPDSYVVCEKGICQGVYTQLPDEYRDFPVKDWGDALIIPGLVDLHVHAPQYAFTGTGMDYELLDWLNINTFPEESRYADISYAERAYGIFVRKLKNSATTRACIFGTLHVPATILLMDMLEESGLKAYVGKVNMDRNSPDGLREESAQKSVEDTEDWLNQVEGRYENVQPILTPRFIPSCTDDLMRRLSKVREKWKLPIQSHLSENQGEIAWVQELCPWSESYGDAYEQLGMFGDGYPAVMAHCVHCTEEEIAKMKKNNVYVAHCPHSNTNLASGIAPVKSYLEKGLSMGLGSDVAGGHTISMFQAMAGAIQVSKLRWRLVDEAQKPLTMEEVFYLGTKGGGSFFGKVGSFEKGYAFDAVVVEDSRLETTGCPEVRERLERIIYLSAEQDMKAKYVEGRRIL